MSKIVFGMSQLSEESDRKKFREKRSLTVLIDLSRPEIGSIHTV